jgi:DNA-binding Lrp family transcriptional regulator
MSLTEKQKKALNIIIENEPISLSELSIELKEDAKTSNKIISELEKEDLIYPNLNSDYVSSSKYSKMETNLDISPEEGAKSLLIDTTNLLFLNIGVTELEDTYELSFDRHLTVESVDKLKKRSEFIVEGNIGSVEIPKSELMANYL